MTVYFTVLVFGKIVFYAGPLAPSHCQAMLDTYQPPVLDTPVIVDGKIATPLDYVPWCMITPTEPVLGTFDYGDDT